MGDEIANYFPMPEFRPKQRETLEKCWELFESGKKLILLEAPVGFGKSAVNTALCQYYQPSAYTTPQLSLIDQIRGDKHLGKYFTEIKGRDNYRCAMDNYLTPVKYGRCKREKIECDRFRICPYYSQKMKAIKSPMALMSTSYFIVDAFLEPPNFSGRKLAIIDEGHLLSEHVADQVSFEVSPWSLPHQVWNKFKNLMTSPPSDNLLASIANHLETLLESYQVTIDGGEALTDEETIEKEKASEWLDKYRRYLDTYDYAEWVWNAKNHGWKATPVYSRWFMEQMIWSRAEMFLTSSATILKPELWIKENGADLMFEPSETTYITVGSTFPPENRPVIDFTVGSMRYDNQADTLEYAVKMLEYIIRKHPMENIAVHLPSYRLAKEFHQRLTTDRKVWLPTPENRDETLEKWKNNGGILLAVAYYEGQDWKYDVCRVQVLAKTLYPDTTDPKVAKRLEKMDYQWLMWIALIKCLQAYGRAIRAPDDTMTFYVLDSQFWNLLKRNWKNIPQWFQEVTPANRWPKKYQKQNGKNMAEEKTRNTKKE